MPQMTLHTLRCENATFRKSSGVSEVNRSYGFRPAFHDTETGATYLSRDLYGKPASVHLLDGLPATVVLARDSTGRVVAVKASVISGFVLDGHFYTREQAMARATLIA